MTGRKSNSSREVQEPLPVHGSERAAMAHLARKIAYTQEIRCKWMLESTYKGHRPTLTAGEQANLKERDRRTKPR